MPQLEQGKVHEVKLMAEKTAKKLKEKIDQGFKVIAPIASCALMIKSHWPLLSPDNKNVALLAKSTIKCSVAFVAEGAVPLAAIAEELIPAAPIVDLAVDRSATSVQLEPFHFSVLSVLPDPGGDILPP